jgi:HD-like signal output (HDOD) protein
LDLPYLTDPLIVILKEILSNSARANAKRVFFSQEGLDITDPDEYRIGIERFPHEVTGVWKEFVSKYPETAFYIKLRFALRNEELQIYAINNVSILPQEWQRINSRFEKSSLYSNIETAFHDTKDDSEGSGLGIVMTLFLLKRAGIDPANFKIVSKDGLTLTSLRIPVKTAPVEFRDYLRQSILPEIRQLPALPKSVSNIIQLCNDPSASIPLIAMEIQKDPSLTAQIFKLVNSAGYINRMNNPNLTDAVKIVGINLIRNILLVAGARNILSNRYHHRSLQQIWDSSNRVSFFAKELSNDDPDIFDVAPVAGLLYELGKIVLLSMNPELVKNTDSLLGKGKLQNSAVIEEMELGISHPEIGYYLASHWQFPEILTQVIRYQQKPLQAPQSCRKIVEVVYLAVKIHETLRNMVDYFAIEPEVLTAQGIFSESDYLELIKKFDQKYRLIEESTKEFEKK